MQRIGVGRDNIAVEAATARGAWVANVPDYCVEEVSDHAVAMIMGWLRGIVPLDREVKAGRWTPAAARLQAPDEPRTRRPHARRAQQMARAFHTSQDGHDAPRPGAPLPLGEAVIVTETPQPDND